MRKLPLLIAAALALPAAAHAQELNRSSQQLELAANAPVACVISPPSVGNQANASFVSTSASSGQVNITEFVDPTSAVARASPASCRSATNSRSKACTSFRLISPREASPVRFSRACASCMPPDSTALPALPRIDADST